MDEGAIHSNIVEQCGELLQREDPVALGHELTDLLPVHVVGERGPPGRFPSDRDWPLFAQDGVIGDVEEISCRQVFNFGGTPGAMPP